MSYEGRVQVICKNGHYDVFDCYAEQEQCSGYHEGCRAPIVWRNAVDDTNCDAVGEIRREDLAACIIRPAVIHTCTCGVSHEHVRELYRPPSEKETETWRSWWDGDQWLRLPSKV